MEGKVPGEEWCLLSLPHGALGLCSKAVSPGDIQTDVSSHHAHPSLPLD